MTKIQGVTQDTSSDYYQNPLTLASNQSCNLKLNISGSQLSGDVVSGQGANGYNASIVQQNLGLTTYGLNNSFTYSYTLADDFTVPNGKTWRIDTLTFFLQQINSGLNPPITSLNYVIYDAPPTNPNKKIVCGNLLVNATIRLNQWSKIYRVISSDPLDTNRPIMQVSIDSGGCVLNANTYWLVWSSTGSNLLVGVGNAPITINGQTTTGNGLQSYNFGATWGSAADGNSGQYPQGFPFILQGGAY